jgi:hypothetical protein
MPTPGQFEAYFHKTADKAEELFSSGFRTEAYLMTTVAIDALAAIWRHDFGMPEASGTKNFASFVREFVADPAAERICVVFFAEDLLAFGPARLHPVAQRLLEQRAASRNRVPGVVEGEAPHAHKDVTWTDLVVEEPSLANENALEELAEDYTRSALAYRLYRCGPAHALSRGSRTSGFSSGDGDDEISYFPRYLSGNVTLPISLKIGIKTFTQWLRTAATRYAAACAKAGKRPADNFDASASSLALLHKKWRKVT